MSYLAIDIGGTKTLIATLSDRGHVTRRAKFLTPKNLDDFLNTLSQTLSVSFRDANPSVIVIAIPGFVKDNRPVWFGNRPWENPPIFEVVHKHFNCPIFFENDASLATVYESKFYSGTSIYLTFSTGIGGGIAKKGVLVQPYSNNFEPGHNFYPWEGENLEWEDIASCRALEKKYGVIATDIKGRDSYKDIATRLSLGLADIISVLNPRTIIIGGPLGMLFPHFYFHLRHELKQILGRKAKLPRIVRARYPKESVIHGVYTYAKQHQFSRPAQTATPVNKKHLRNPYRDTSNKDENAAE